jgi:alanine racemase
MTGYPNTVTIDLSALIFNFGQIKSQIGRTTKIMGVVKSDAYGHGLVRVSRALEENGVDCLGVAHLDEAIKLREAGIRLSIVILTGVGSRDECNTVVKKDLTLVTYDPEVIDLLAQECGRMGKKAHVQLKIDTGMGRLGIPYTDVGPFLVKIRPLDNLIVEGLMSHLSSADDPKSDFTNKQVARFKTAINAAGSVGFKLSLNNLANSAGIVSFRESHFDMVRPGIMLYGGLPSPEFKSPIRLKPVMGFKGKVIQIRELPDRTPVSYGRTYYTDGPRRLAILSAGYGDGLPRSISNNGIVLIRGQRAPIVGRICMNLTCCDITDLLDAQKGDEVIFLGSQGKEGITGDDMAGWADTISYEIFCSIGQRCPEREYTT